MSYTGKQIVLETLASEGVAHVFGNPGTTELPLIDGLLDYPQIEYVLCLHEAVAVSMADAYAHATGRAAVVNLHVGPGLGNGLGSLYNAYKGRTPLLVTAGQQDSRMALREPLLGHDLVAMAAPLTKWSVEARTADELPLILHRAFKTAREAPSGPVFVSLPIDVMEQRTHQAPIAPSAIHHRAAPDPAGVAEAVRLMASAEAPAIVCGDEIARSGAVSALVMLAERLGAPVHNEVLPARVNFPMSHPHARERMANDQAAILARLEGCDVILLLGGRFFEEVWYTPVHPFPSDAAVIQVEPVPSTLARNYRVDCGLVADLRLAIEALLAGLDERGDRQFALRARRRSELLRRRKAAERAAQLERARAETGNQPMSPARLMAELAESLPKNVVIAGEAITATPDLLRTLCPNDPGGYLASRGGGIGQGLPSAVGLKLANPDRPVLGVVGDGSSLYSVQALWSAAHHRIPVVFVILNNGTYRILKLNMKRFRRDAGVEADRGYPHLDLGDPPVDYVSIATGFGVKAERIERAEDVGAAVTRAFAAEAPYLLDVLVDGAI